MIEKKACEPREENGWQCKKSYRVVKEEENVFVADIEDYTLLFAHTYFRGEVMGASTAHQGFYYECRDEKTKEVLRSYPCEGKLHIRPIRCLPGLDCGYKAENVDDVEQLTE